MSTRHFISCTTAILITACEGGSTNAPPQFTSASIVEVPENAAHVFYTSEAYDPDNDVLSFSIQGSDAAHLEINSVTGELRFINPPNFESPTDFGNDNQYDIQLVVEDNEGNSDQQALEITVQDVNEVRLKVVSPLDHSVLDYGEITTIPVIVQVEAEDQLPPNFNVTANGSALQQSTTNPSYWSGGTTISSGGTTLSIVGLANNLVVAEAEINIKNQNLPIGEWQLSLDTTRNRLAIADAGMQEAHFISIEDASHTVKDIDLQGEQWTYDIKYSANRDSFFVNTFRLFEFDENFETHTSIPLQIASSNSSRNSILPWGISIDDSSNNLYVTDIIDGNFFGIIDLEDGSNSTGFNSPIGTAFEASYGYITTDPTSRVAYIANRYDAKIDKINLDTKTRDTIIEFPWPNNTYKELLDITRHPISNLLYVASPHSSSIIQIDSGTGQYRTLSGKDIFNQNSNPYPVIGSGPSLEHSSALTLDINSNRIFTLNKNSIISVDLTNGDREILKAWGTANTQPLYSQTTAHFFLPNVRTGIQFSFTPGQLIQVDYSNGVASQKPYDTSVMLGQDRRTRHVIINDNATLALAHHVSYSVRTDSESYEILNLTTGENLGEIPMDAVSFAGGYYADSSFKILTPKGMDNRHELISIDPNTLLKSTSSMYPIDGYTILDITQQGDIIYTLQDNDDDSESIQIAEIDPETYMSVRPTDASGYTAFFDNGFRGDIRLISGESGILYLCGAKNIFLEFDTSTNTITSHSITTGLTEGYIIDVAKDISGEFYWLHTSEGSTLTYKDGTAIIVMH